jgi:CSLREA domain-containing protein
MSRFRLSRQGSLGFTGVAPDGEVEDYEVSILGARHWVVDSTGDGSDATPGDGTCDDGTGWCTLRAAMEEANSLANLPAGPDGIAFNIAGTGPHTIQPTTPLPTIFDAIVIDGTTQPSYAGTPLMELDGTAAGAGTNGLWLAAGNSTVRGLAINRFDGSGIQLTTNGGNTLEANFIGTNPPGTADRGNLGWGIRVAGSHGNTIGGTTSAVRNLISGNEMSAVLITGANSNVLLGNYLATDTYPASSAQSSRTATLAVSGLSVGERIVATATDAVGNTSEFSASVVVAAPLMAAGGPSPTPSGQPALTNDQLQLIRAAALTHWSLAGAMTPQLSALASVQLVIADLPGAYLGLAAGNRITLDADAAGYGWYVDPTPQCHDDDLFDDRMDLLTAVMHEMGHLLGLAHAEDSLSDEVMAETLTLGQRRLPNASDVEKIFANDALD